MDNSKCDLIFVTFQNSRSYMIRKHLFFLYHFVIFVISRERHESDHIWILVDFTQTYFSHCDLIDRYHNFELIKIYFSQPEVNFHVDQAIINNDI